jgi:hypothetical protein
MRQWIDGQRIDARPAIDTSPSEDAVLPPRQALDESGDRDPELVGRGAEAHAADFSREHALDTGGRDALPGRDDTGI